MRYYSSIIPLALLAMGITNCKSSNNTTIRDAKQISSPQVNAVHIITLKKGPFSKQIITNGKSYAYPKADLHFKTNGVLKKIAKSNGDFVQEGDTIAILDREDLQLSLYSAQLGFEKARLEYYDILAGQGFSPKDTLNISPEILSMAKMRSGFISAKNTLKRADYDYEASILRAPFSGVIANLFLNENEQVGSEKFCTIMGKNRKTIKFSIMENEYAFISKNQRVLISPFARPDISIKGILENINPTVDENGQIELCAIASESSNTLLDGMNVKVIIEKDIPNQLVVPRSALVIRDGFDVLFTYTHDGTAHWVYVNILDKNSEYAIVEANKDRGATLEEGDIIIITGNLNLADGSKVTIL